MSNQYRFNGVGASKPRAIGIGLDQCQQRWPLIADVRRTVAASWASLHMSVNV
jgi:hypothetical protein